MRFLCPFCHFAITAADDTRGYRTTCGSCGKNVLVPANPFDEGCVIGDFAIRSKLGEGSIGAVYKAFQLSLERVVALKILSDKYSTTVKGRTDFLREARAAATLVHNNLVQSYAVGEENGICYMAMTYIDGMTLKSRIRREGPIPCDEALHIVQQVAEALHYAWTESRIIHRDIKPDNIMLSEHGVVKVADLGLAMNQSEWREDMDISGSPSYMSPEQFAGEKLDTRSDIYSLGVTLFQMLCGELPFDAETIRSIAKQHFEVSVPNLQKKVPGLPAGVNQLVQKMMAKMPEKRFKDMDELLHAIWNLRQKTAPDRNAIPDVHTISMKRLDYEIQIKAADEMTAAHNRSARNTPPQTPVSSSGGVIAAWVLGIPLLVLLAALALMVFRNNAKNSDVDLKLRTLEKDIAMFEILSADTSLPAGELELEADRIMKKLEQQGNSSLQIRALQSHIVEMIRSRTSHETAARDAAKSAMLEAELAERDAEKKLLQQENTDLRKKLDEASDAVTECARLQQEINTMLEQLQQKDQETVTLREQNMQDTEKLYGIVRLRYAWMISEYWRRFRFASCEAILNDGLQRHPGLDGFLRPAVALNQLGKNIYEAFQNGKTEYARQHFGTAVVSHLQNGAVHCFSDDNGAAKVIPWNELTTEQVWQILSVKQTLFPSEHLTKAMYEVLRGNYGVAYSLAPAEIQSFADACAKYDAWRIRMILPQNKSEADTVFQDFRQRFAGVPSFSTLLNELLAEFGKFESEKIITPGNNTPAEPENQQQQPSTKNTAEATTGPEKDKGEL